MLRRIAPVSLLMFLFGGSPSLFAQSDDFDDGNDDGWMHYDPLASVGQPPATYSFPNGGYRIEAPVSPDPENLGQARAGSYRADTTYTDFSVSVDLIDWDNTLPQYFGPTARLSDLGLGTTGGYAFFYFSESGHARLNRIDNELSSAPDQPDPTNDFEANLDPAKDYRMTFSGVGGNLLGQIFDLTDLSTPLARLAAFDSTYTSGHSGIVVVADSPIPELPISAGDATFDNFVATVPEPSCAGLALVAMAVLAAGCRRSTLKAQ